ncbi:MAG: ABC transporter ATP-binding protein, partial [Bacteroidota bacterium]
AGWLGQRIIKSIRIQLYAHIMRLRASFLNRTPVGTLVTRNISDTETLAEVFSQGMAAFLSDLLQLLCIIGLMFYTNWWLALISMATMPLLLGLTYLFKEKLKRAFRAVRDALAALNAFLQVRITGMSVVQIFHQEQQQAAKFDALNKLHQAANIQSALYYAIYFPSISFINSASIGLLIWYGAGDVMRGATTFGELVAFLMYIQLFFRPLHLIADRFNTLQMGLVSTERIVKLLENNEQVVNEGSYQPQRLRGEVVFQDVWFAYDRGGQVLRGVSFHVAAKSSLAIVGATGAGKSTIVNLLVRFHNIQQGKILIDGTDIMEYDLQTLRQQVGLVLQDTFLFSGSIYDNITLGNGAIAKEQVVAATRLIGLHDFILQLPGGYDYNVMERGVMLSMGQRQLLAFARVLVYDPALLILDEATSAMDTATEALIQNATAILMQNRTCILIAHRLSTVRHADSILVLKDGVVQEQGTHASLMAQGGHYASLQKAAV